MSDPHHDHVILTYRYLRLATLAVLLLLGVALVLERSGAACWQTSISAYYYTPVHGAFVAALCAIGALLIVYQGNSDTEDIVLNYAGFLAFIVAFVPTPREALCSPDALPAVYDLSPGIRNNVWAVVVAGACAEFLRLWLTRRASRPPLSLWARRATYIGWVVLAGGFVAFLAFPEAFAERGHTTAAVGMFAGIIAVVLINAYSADAAGEDPRYVRAYQSIAAMMAITLSAIIAIRGFGSAGTHLVIIVEVALIAAFAAFWLVQTTELWDVIDRREMAPRALERTGL